MTSERRSINSSVSARSIRRARDTPFVKSRARRVNVGTACVDIQPFPKTNVLVLLSPFVSTLLYPSLLYIDFCSFFCLCYLLHICANKVYYTVDISCFGDCSNK